MKSYEIQVVGRWFLNLYEPKDSNIIGCNGLYSLHLDLVLLEVKTTSYSGGDVRLMIPSPAPFRWMVSLYFKMIQPL